MRGTKAGEAGLQPAADGEGDGAQLIHELLERSRARQLLQQIRDEKIARYPHIRTIWQRTSKRRLPAISHLRNYP